MWLDAPLLLLIRATDALLVVCGLFGFQRGVGHEVTKDILGHLMDSVDPEIVLAAERAALGVDGVQHAPVRARWMGRTLLVDRGVPECRRQHCGQ